MLHWETYQKEGFNPVTEEVVMTERRRIAVDEAIPMKDGFGDRVREIVSGASNY